MGIEAATYLAQLISANPQSMDGRNTADDHLRLIKAAIKSSFPAVSGALNATHAELSFVAGVTSAIQSQIDVLSESGSIDLTVSGFSPEPSATFYYARFGSIVVIFQPQVTGSSINNAISTTTALPASLRPAREQIAPNVVMRSSGNAFSTAGARVQTSGLISYQASFLFPTAGFSATKGIEPCAFAYSLQ